MLAAMNMKIIVHVAALYPILMMMTIGVCPIWVALIGITVILQLLPCLMDARYKTSEKETIS